MPLTLGVTGADGLIGWHVRAHLRAFRPEVAVRPVTRAGYADETVLADLVAGTDVVIHCAGMNRGDEAAVEAANIELAERLVRACERAATATGRFPAVVYTNSVQIGRDSGYGRGKRAAAEILGRAAAARGARFVDLVLPHVFGEFGKPFHNSVVSTFCHQLACGGTPEIHVDGGLELLHAQDVAARCIAAAVGTEDGRAGMSGVPLKVSALLEKLRAMAASYVERNVVPEIADSLDRALFNTLRSYRFPQSAQTPLTSRRDARGALFEAVKTRGGGQAFLSTTQPGATRGNHFHTHKFERFLVCGGEAEIRLRRLFDDAVHVFRINGDEPCCFDMPTFCTHSITNVGAGELTTLFWASEIFDPAQPDTYAEPVLL